ncbi:phosphotransferase [Paenibacillus contaminans]|uniref:Aminoglycoside phosphotransferase family protein n=1 Tax=Paenibacillus contaminans TaxID=450362 RepID=A0A329LMB2_9BACL|nr:phosphotransferase [Paenibacillus contaminans]RAV08182.1 aminoglycoside phosphotransferase family protein [Paenibacillus contaminans]
MSGLQYNLHFEKLCRTLRLGELAGEPEPISGGFLHRMYAVETTQGKYAVKALNPQIMLRPTAMQNYIHSEQIANIAVHHVPALPAKRFNGIFMHEIDKQYYLVFDWVLGKSLKPDEITITHCNKLGAILADLHMTDFSGLDVTNDPSNHEQPADWNDYLLKGQEHHAAWVNLLRENINKLYEWNTKAIIAAEQLASNMVISHRDMDPKNVLWIQDNPVLIDWEAAGYTSPMQELTETAVYWSESEAGNVDKGRFLAFIDGYTKRYGTLEADWRTVLDSGFLGKLGWLEYNLKRSLRIECTDEEEQRLGTEQAVGTIHAIRRYADMSSELEKWLINKSI